MNNPFIPTPPETIVEYAAIAEPDGKYLREYVGINPQGIRWAQWPYCKEEYISDKEPNLAMSSQGVLARNRYVTWKRISRLDIPPGWKEVSKKPWRIDGYFDLEDKDYIDKWDRNAKRNVDKWHAHRINNVSIEKISFQEFASAYAKSSVARKVSSFYIDTLARKLDILDASSHPELWGVREYTSKHIIAGVAVHFFSAQKISIHECPFIIPQWSVLHASAGLMERWFSESSKRGFRLMITPYMWQSHDPLTWKGLSDFKMHFGFTPHAYPPALGRFVRGRIY